ncbi:MAG: type IV secretory system conjugative DNA transfer family protein, partial [Halanaerobiales bacterium]
MDSQRVKRVLLELTVYIMVSTIVSLYLGSLLGGNPIEFNPTALKLVLQDSIIFLFGFGVLLLFILASRIDKDPSDYRDSSESRTKSGKNMEQYYSSRLVTEKELKHEKKFMFSLFSDLKKKNKDGILIRAEYKRKKLHINMYKPIHTMIVGTTGSGKTTTFIDPSIQILSEIKTKPSMVITDPKGELYQNHSAKLEKQGYKVQVIDLREPQISDRWNPLERAYDFHYRAHNLMDEIKVYKKVSPQKVKDVKSFKSKKYGETWYAFNGIAYPDKATLKQALKSKKSDLISKAENEIEDISQTLCPITGNEPMWSMGAQGFIKGILLAMLEDSLIPETGMTREKFIFFNMSKIANKRDVDKK